MVHSHPSRKEPAIEGKPRIEMMNCPHCSYSHMSNTACPQCGTVAAEDRPTAADAVRPSAAPRARGELPVRVPAERQYSESGDTVLDGHTFKHMSLIVVTVLGLGLCLYVSFRWDSVWGNRGYEYREYDGWDDGRPARTDFDWQRMDGRPSSDPQKVNTEFTLKNLEDR